MIDTLVHTITGYLPDLDRLAEESEVYHRRIHTHLKVQVTY